MKLFLDRLHRPGVKAMSLENSRIVVSSKPMDTVPELRQQPAAVPGVAINKNIVKS